MHSPTLKFKQTTKGFTLIEVLISTVVLTLGISLTLPTIVMGYRNLELARASTSLTQALQGRLEELRMLNWAQIEALPETSKLTLTSQELTGFNKPTSLAVTRTVKSVPSFSNTRELRIEATWKTMDGKEHSRSVLTRYTKGGLHDYYYGN